MATFASIEVLKSDGQVAAAYPLLQRQVTFGRSESCDIRVQMMAVSKIHAAVKLNENGEIVLENMSSTNGTYYERDAEQLLVQDALRLNDGDVFVIGGRKFRLAIPTSLQKKLFDDVRTHGAKV